MDQHRHHFSVAGIPVRVEPVFFVISLLLGLQLAEEDVRYLFVWLAVAFVSILVHELGHGLTLKAFGVRSEITLQGLGGVTTHRGRLSRHRSVLVSVAGSLTALAVLWLPAHLAYSSDWRIEQSLLVQNAVRFVVYLNLWVSLANLLPIRPLDGGNVVTELAGAPVARRVSLVAALAAGAYAFSNEQRFAGVFVLFLAFLSFQEIQAERSGGTPPPNPFR